MALIKYNERIPSSFSGMLDQFFTDYMSNKKLQHFIPNVDVIETETMYEIHLAIPGMKKEDFKLSISKDQLTISGERKTKEEKATKKFHTKETQYGSFSRSFFLPENASKENIEAVYQDGILEVKIPKDEKKDKEKNISVK